MTNLSTTDYNALTLAMGPGTTAAADIDAALGGTLITAGSITNAMLAPLALQPTVKTATAGIGYATGAGAAVTQASNRTTAVTCSGLSGQITTSSASLAAEAAAAFTVTNTSVAIGDVVVVSQQSGSNGGNTLVQVTTTAGGSFQIQVCNNNAAAGTAETGAIIINFAVIKAVAA